MRLFKNFLFFRKKPKTPYKDYSKSHISKDKGIVYEENFKKNKGRKLMWELEKYFFKKNIRKPISHLDFACGTGRLFSIVEAEKKVGIDISRSMIEVCSNHYKNIDLINKDFREIKSLKNKFNLITAFRFLANADELLREEAFAFFYKNLNKNGFLIFNNHRSFWSLNYILFRLLGLGFYAEGLTHKKIKTLIDKNKFEIKEIYSLGIFPHTEEFSFIPWPLLKFIEYLNLRYLSNKHLFGYNNIYVCKKK